MLNRENFYNQENRVTAYNLAMDVSRFLMVNGIRNEPAVFASIYLARKASEYSNLIDDYHELSNCNDSDGRVLDMIEILARVNISSEQWINLREMCFRCATEVLEIALMLPYENYPYAPEVVTPESITKLANKILNLSENDTIADICSGNGNYIINTAIECPKASYYGVELNRFYCSIARAKSEFVPSDIEIELKDAFYLMLEENERVFTKIFSNYPFGLRLKNLNNANLIIEKLLEEYDGASKGTSSDWLFNALIMKMLGVQGKAVAIMTNGSTWNELDVPMRKAFVENGYIESIISLPAKMFQATSIPTTMIVMSHNNTAGVRIVDATKLCVMGRRVNEFSGENICEIINALANDTEYSRFISIEELRENSYSLNLNRYLIQDVAIVNPTPFAKVINKITRGAQLSAAQLDELISEVPTDTQYMMLANIKDGMVDNNLPYLQEFDKKLEKYCIKSNNLILSKNGYPYKVAVAMVKEGKKVIGNGNMYIIELNEELANPYYIKAFFESEQGIAALKSITVGATIQSFGVDSLKKLIIPLPSKEEQERIAERYQSILDEISVLQLKIEKAKGRLKNIFSEEGEN